MFEASGRKKFVIGAKQVTNIIRSGKASKVYVASDCDPDIIDPVTALAKDMDLPIIYIATRKELGEMCGIDVKASCAVQTI